MKVTHSKKSAASTPKPHAAPAAEEVKAEATSLAFKTPPPTPDATSASADGATATPAQAHPTDASDAQASATTAATTTQATPVKDAPVVLGPYAALVAQLAAIEAGLGLNIVVPPNDKAQIQALSRVTDVALSLAADVVASDPARFADFLVIAVGREAAAALAPLLKQVAVFAEHLEKAVQNARAPAAIATLVLYQVVKGLGRITGNETMREKIDLFKAELAPKRKNPKPKQTKTEKATKRAAKQQAARIAKAVAALAKEGITVPTGTTGNGGTGGNGGGTPAK